MVATTSANVSGTATPVAAPSSGTATPQQNKHSNHSMKQLWKELKGAVSEHHRSVNAAYISYYGQGQTRL
ncbi:hypothetical protein K458DRAFT_414039 [Lentithecium fluviatile CBS 122367]|uniref:Uncharacterized protein n=1 Tax=Lentithecium fluviatile CBS 122367 TaxID=1168545 RepID=A0A6G1JI22_9PLEO|nr:hypothetical protein K458DRAFT_414039 [Lentithecium fluviatile CBS 122367]